MPRSRAFVLLLLLLPAARAAAHKPSDSYLKITNSAGRLAIQWDIALKDLEFLVGLDSDGNGEITWLEVRAQRDAIESHVLPRLRIAAGGSPCQIRCTSLLASRHSDGGYAVLELECECGSAPSAVTLEYSLLFEADPTHRGLVLFVDGAATSTQVLSVDARTLTLDAAGTSLWMTCLDFVRVGVWHILIGFDHILFLAALLLPAVFERRDRAWQPAARLRSTFASVLKIVSMFTLAHSLTLWLAVMGYITLPSRLVEASIALSIVITAANNLRPALPLSSWALAFLFGLIHGFGFANVLLDLGLTRSSLAVSLLGFNLGVELGQLAIVAAFLPLAFLVRDTSWYRRTVFGFGSLAVGVLGGLWTVERLLNVRILGV